MKFKGLKIALGGAFICFSSLSGVSTTSLRIDPHQYPGVRGNEPQEQMVFSVNQDWQNPVSAPSEIKAHFTGEGRGRRDVSLDIDRAWIRFGSFTLGRIHPYDLSHHPDSKQPWGLLGATQSQSRGLLLGYEYGNLEPSPYLLGHLGVHYWSDEENDFQWGLSATPFFLPTMGSEVSLSAKEPSNVGRFARRPPGRVLVDGKTYPLYFEVDSSRVFQDVILNPQVFLQTRYKNTWVVLSRSPSPDPLASSEEDYLVVTPDSLHAYAKVKPRFEQRTGLSVTQKISLLEGNWPTTAIGTLAFFSNSYWGYEAGLQSGFVTLSLLEERNFSPVTSNFRTSESRYTDLLAQIDVRVPIKAFYFSTGAKHHLHQNDLWFRNGIGYEVTHNLSFESTLDLFAGPDNSYFGEWRSNDRISLVMKWELEG